MYSPLTPGASVPTPQQTPAVKDAAQNVGVQVVLKDGLQVCPKLWCKWASIHAISIFWGGLTPRIFGRARICQAADNRVTNIPFGNVPFIFRVDAPFAKQDGPDERKVILMASSAKRRLGGLLPHVHANQRSSKAQLASALSRRTRGWIVRWGAELRQR